MEQEADHHPGRHAPVRRTMIKFIHSADIHLDSPLHRLEVYDGAPVDRIRQATRRALENLVDLALGEAVDFVLIAGDLFGGRGIVTTPGSISSARSAGSRQRGSRSSSLPATTMPPAR